jgi:hypothetical protein
MRETFYVVSRGNNVSDMHAAPPGALARCISGLMHLSLSLSLFGFSANR